MGQVTRNRHCVEFKARVALEAVEGMTASCMV
jgi:hypothetical protein